MNPTSEYIKVSFNCNALLADLLVAELAQMGFDSFEEKEEGLDAYILETDYNEALVATLTEQYSSMQAGLSFIKTGLPKVNWNEEWEKNYQPIVLVNRCYVRASFHPPRPEFEIELVITPKMSFGTGHHATTGLMAEYLLEQPPVGLSVLDLGAGTGILALLALKLGAAHATGTDVDEWCMDNAAENAAINGYAAQYLPVMGAVAQITDHLAFNYPLVIANINKNILLAEISHYALLTAPGGRLLMSGFYDTDLADLVNAASVHGLSFVSSKEKDRWTAAEFIKK